MSNAGSLQPNAIGSIVPVLTGSGGGGGGGGGGSLQDAYDNGNTISLTAATPVAITTTGAGQDGITITDGAATLRLRGNVVLLPDGGIGSPSLAFASDVTTGWRLAGASDVRLELGSTLAARYTSGLIQFRNAGTPSLSIQAAATTVEQGQLRIQDGSSAAPAIAFDADVQTGIFRISSGAMGFASNGTNVFSVRSYIESSVTHRFQNGTETAPSITFGSDTNTGIYRVGADEIGLTAGAHGFFSGRRATNGQTLGINLTPEVDQTAAHVTGYDLVRIEPVFTADAGTGEKWYFRVTDGVSTLGGWRRDSGGSPADQFVAPGGTVARPGIAFEGDVDTGIAQTTSGEMRFVSASVERMRVFSGQVRFVDGTEASPAIAFLSGGGSTGIRRGGADELFFSQGGSNKLEIAAAATISYQVFQPSASFSIDLGSSSAQWDTVHAARYRAVSGSASAFQLAYGFSSDPDSGMYLDSSGGLGIGLAIGGTLIAKVRGTGGLILSPNAPASSSGTDVLGIDANLSVNQSGTAGYRAIDLNVQELSTGSGTRVLLNLAVSAASQFSVNSNGRVIAAQDYWGGLGSKTDPTYSWIGGDEGMYKEGANIVGIAANAEAVLVDNSSGDPSFRPDADDVWTLGESGFRWKDVFAAATTINDLILESMNDDAKWVLVEDRRGLFLRDQRTGKAYKLLMEEIDPTEAPRTRDELHAA